MKKLLVLLFSLLISTSVLSKVENWYFERTTYIDGTYIFVSVDTQSYVKCALYDKNKKPIRILEDIVSPPLAEIYGITKNVVIKSVQCWEQDINEYMNDLTLQSLDYYKN